VEAVLAQELAPQLDCLGWPLLVTHQGRQAKQQIDIAGLLG
jgi:hypothetical protein